jgi:hypothetical protein
MKSRSVAAWGWMSVMLLLTALALAPAAWGAVARENGFAHLTFANGKEAIGEVRQSTNQTFVLDTAEGTVELRWDMVTERGGIDAFEYLTQRGLAGAGGGGRGNGDELGTARAGAGWQA